MPDYKPLREIKKVYLETKLFTDSSKKNFVSTVIELIPYLTTIRVIVFIGNFTKPRSALNLDADHTVYIVISLLVSSGAQAAPKIYRPETNRLEM